MRKWLCWLAVVAVACGARAEGPAFFFGGGAHYWKTIDELKEETGLDDSGFSWMASAQVGPSEWVKVEGDLEVFPQGFAGSEDTVFGPQAFLVIGSGLYAAGGIGVYYNSDLEDKWSDPFYVVRAGINIEVLPRIWLDVNANYEFFDWESVKDLRQNIDTDTVTVGAVLRVRL